MIPEEFRDGVIVEKCPCGDIHCDKHYINVGTFYQGTGWSLEEATWIAGLINKEVERANAVGSRVTSQ